MTPFTPDEKRKFDRIKKLTLDVVKAMDNSKQYNVKRYDDMFNVFENVIYKNERKFRFFVI